MLAWFGSLNQLQRIFAYIAIPSTVILLLQTILLIFGIGDDDADMDTSVDTDSTETGGDGLALFSIRGIVAMLCIGGWCGIALLGTEMNRILAIIISVIAGIAALFGMAYLMKAVSKLQSSGNISVENALGKTAQVYIPIPPALSGCGKINITLQEKYTELPAVTNEGEQIRTGETVRVVSVNEAGTLVVERIMRSASNEDIPDATLKN